MCTSGGNTFEGGLETGTQFKVSEDGNTIQGGLETEAQLKVMW
jgi:hypothetical protein